MSNVSFLFRHAFIPTRHSTLALLLAMFIVGCDVGGDDAAVTTSEERLASDVLTPRSIASLRQTGTLRIELIINGEIAHSGIWVAESEGAISLDADRLSLSVNEVIVEFTFQALEDLPARRLASAEHVLPRVLPGESVALSGLFYRYDDSDDDGLFDIHELAVNNTDVDQDGILNIDDTDSDNDGISDGMDESPYGDLLDSPIVNAGQRFELRLEGEDNRTLAIERVFGDVDEVMHLVDTIGAIDLDTPPGWPSSVVESDTTGWTAFEVQGTTEGLCQDFRISVDASSLSTTLTRSALLYFRRPGEPARMAPIGATSIPDLDSFSSNGIGESNGPYNDGLRLVLVPRSTLGWIELWSDRNLNGDVCRVNLATPINVAG